MFLLIYVDDIIIIDTSSQQVQRFITTLAHRFSLKNLGYLAYFLRVEAIHTSSDLFLSQYKYIRDLLEKHNMFGANAISTSISSTVSLKLHDGALPTDPTKYRQVIGSMQVLWYLKGTIHLGLFHRNHSPLTLHAFANADWAGNSDDRTSTSVYVVFLGCNPISWSSKKQKTVARSSTEAEYRAIATTAAEINWVQNLFYELQAQSPSTPTIYWDNVGATYVCANPVFHSCMKHIAIDFHFVRDQVVQEIATCFSYSYF
ncbi:Retrovirus-related Pol polyprotein from transposon RE1 [Vitis vinifera]|uniref:Retrovirus-related Pol polyprotein from transposon RE1 n=1 Tax=Vitis vinifera TaxID=29760 RepID=A0A438K200_VITVI|nr:Retrovirus-related Pol polyprotein from transposon RE1 [Vitis vinifera]